MKYRENKMIKNIIVTAKVRKAWKWLEEERNSTI
jgi:hypothetical protein